MDKYGLREFGCLETSTMTVMVYTNIIFDIPLIFECIKLTNVEVPLTKKQKNVDKKAIEAPYGTVISVQYKAKIRGIDLRKKKKHWCTICQPKKVQGDEEVKVNTITEQLEPDTEPFISGRENDAVKIIYYCSNCQKKYPPYEIKKINHFLNQLTVVLSIGKQPLLNIMLFKDNLKIAGCKNIEDAQEAILVLWQDFIAKMIPKGKAVERTAWKLKNGAKQPRFVFETVMRNVDFQLGFPIERRKLNILMNDEMYRNQVFMSQYEPTGHTNVNIKMYSIKPPKFKYDCLVIPLKGDAFFIALDDIPYKNPKKKAKEKKYITFIVFSSSEIILSGKYEANMKDMYNFFVKTVFTHKDVIRERLKSMT